MADRGISPRVTNTVDLGSASKAWRKLYAKRIDEGTYIPGAFNKKETFTSSGSFTAPVTGTYRITLQGGGGGGGGAWTYNNIHGSGGGGGEGGKIEFYETLTAGTSYSYTIGAGGSGGTAGSTTSGTGGDGTRGGNSVITIGGLTYTGQGGEGGTGFNSAGRGGIGGRGLIQSGGSILSIQGGSSPGGSGSTGTVYIPAGVGGAGISYITTAVFPSGGGVGGRIDNTGTYYGGEAGGDGYITFEYYDPTA